MPPPDKFDLTKGTLTPINTTAPKKFDLSKGTLKPINTVDFTGGPTNKEGQYVMIGPDKKAIPVAYSQVEAASKAGFVMHPTSRATYTRDAAADPNLKNISIPGMKPGVKVVGKNFAGQPIVAGEEQAQDGSALGRLGSSFVSPIVDTVKGFYHTIADKPKDKTEEVLSLNPVALLAKRMLVDSSNAQAEKARSEFEQAKTDPSDAAAHNTRGIVHAVGSGVPMVGPWVADVWEKVAIQVGKGDYAGAVGTLAGNAALSEAPKFIGKGASLVAKSPRSMVETITKNSPRMIKELAEETEKSNTDAVTQHEKALLGDPDAKTPGSTEQLGVIEATRQRELQYDQDEMAAQVKAKEKLDMENEAQRRKTNADNLKKYEEQGKSEQKAAEERHEAVQKVSEIKAKNELALKTEVERQKVEGEHSSASALLAEKVKKAFTAARDNYNATWKLWRDKVQNVMAPMGTVVDVVKEQEKTLSPEQVPIFRDILRTTAASESDLGDLEQLRNQTSRSNFNGLNYSDLDPSRRAVVDRALSEIGANITDTGDGSGSSGSGSGGLKQIPASRLHTWKSQLEVAVRKAKGPLKHSIGQVLQSVRALEEQVSTQAGAGKELLDARAISGPYYDAFYGSEPELPPAARKTLREQVPEHVKKTEAQQHLERIAAYDPSINVTAKLIDDLAVKLDEINKMQKKLPHPKDLKPLPPKPAFDKPKTAKIEPFTPNVTENRELVKRPKRVPIPDRPVEKNITPDTVKERSEKGIKEGSQTLENMAIRRGMYAGLAGLAFGLNKGLAEALMRGVGAGVAVMTGTMEISNLLDKPEVRAWIGKITPEKAAVWEKLPPKQKALFTQDMKAIIDEADKKKVPVSPALRLFVTGGVASQKAPAKKTPQELVDDYNKAHPDKQPIVVPQTAVPQTVGNQSSLKPTHRYDARTGTIVAA